MRVESATKYRVLKFELTYAEKPENDQDYIYTIHCEKKIFSQSISGLAAIMIDRRSFMIGFLSKEEAQKSIDGDIFEFQGPVEVVCVKMIESTE
jgi:hypothetical protein